jgi:hypothetical protein
MASILVVVPQSLDVLSVLRVMERHLLGVVERKTTVIKVAIDGIVQEAQFDELLIDLINRTGGTDLVTRRCLRQPRAGSNERSSEEILVHVG